MSITNELIEWAESLAAISPRGQRKSPLWVQLIDIADRIDAEHERAVCDARHDALYGANESDMADLGWVRLPKDADGECIRVGDKMDGYGKTIEVVELRIGRSGWVIVSRDGNAYADTSAFAHHKPPTVEDVLAEFFEQVGDGLHTLEAMDTQLIIAKYAARLRLADDGGEQ